MAFRLAAKNLYLTFPQCTRTKEYLINSIKTFFNDNLVYAVVAHELHKDGTDHLHALVSLKERYESRNPNCLDILANKHGNYQTARSTIKVMEYITKDGDYVSEGVDPEEFLELARNKKSTKSAIIARKIIDGDEVKDIIEEYPGYAMINLAKMIKFKQFVSTMSKKPEEEWGGVDEMDYWPAEAQTIVRWLNKNIMKPRKFKQKQLYVQGPTGVGKTTMINNLEKYCRVYYLPYEEFYDYYMDGEYDLIVIDEFKGQKKVTFLNKLLEGSNMPMPQKGQQTMKTDNLPVIILSNYHPDNAYKNIDYHAMQALTARLECVYIGERMQLNFYNSVDWYSLRRRQLRAREVIDLEDSAFADSNTESTIVIDREAEQKRMCPEAQQIKREYPSGEDTPETQAMEELEPPRKKRKNIPMYNEDDNSTNSSGSLHFGFSPINFGDDTFLDSDDDINLNWDPGDTPNFF